MRSSKLGMRVGALALVCVLAMAAGCSSFRGDARRVAKSGTNGGGSGIEGLWEGRWYDEKKPSHGGRLQCVLTRTGDTLYRLSTRSTWWGIFSAAQDTTVVVTPVGVGQYSLIGDKDIWLFGGHTVTGRVDATTFNATYTVGSHVGRMELRRPGPTLTSADAR